jgi:hypothetical protein
MSNTMPKIRVSPNNKEFIEKIKNLKEGDKLTIDGIVLIVEGVFNRPTHFNFHQRIFPAGVILKKKDSNARIFLEAEKIGMVVEKVGKGEFVDKQIGPNGELLPAERGLPRNKVDEELLAEKKVD